MIKLEIGRHTETAPTYIWRYIVHSLTVLVKLQRNSKTLPNFHKQEEIIHLACNEMLRKIEV